MNLLIKFPTRQRPDTFIRVLGLYRSHLSGLNRVKFLISCDNDDPTTNNDNFRKRVHKVLSDIEYEIDYADNKNKIQAINAGLTSERLDGFDVILLASDDMIPVKYDYDDYIAEDFEEHFPDYDGVLWYNDGYQAKNLNTLPILGVKYFNRFGYIYHPSYYSLWCDNEFMDVASILHKQVYIDEIIINHQHPVWTNQPWDDLQKKNDMFNNTDRENYYKRKSNNFDL